MTTFWLISRQTNGKNKNMFDIISLKTIPSILTHLSLSHCLEIFQIKQDKLVFSSTIQ